MSIFDLSFKNTRQNSNRWKLMGSEKDIKGKLRKDSNSIIRSKHVDGNYLAPFVKKWASIDVCDWDYTRLNPKLKKPDPVRKDSVYTVVLYGIRYLVVRKLDINSDELKLSDRLTVGFIDTLRSNKLDSTFLYEGYLSENTSTLREAKILIARHFRSVKNGRIMRYSKELKNQIY